MEKSAGQIAYDAYCKERDWKSFHGEPLPRWEEQDDALRAAWQAGAEAVLRSADAVLTVQVHGVKPGVGDRILVVTKQDLNTETGDKYLHVLGQQFPGTEFVLVPESALLAGGPSSVTLEFGPEIELSPEQQAQVKGMFETAWKQAGR